MQFEKNKKCMNWDRMSGCKGSLFNWVGNGGQADGLKAGNSPANKEQNTSVPCASVPPPYNGANVVAFQGRMLKIKWVNIQSSVGGTLAVITSGPQYLLAP